MLYAIDITVPGTNTEERMYALDFIFHEMMDIDYSIRTDLSTNDYVIGFAGKRIVIRDHFFSHHPQPLSYLRGETVPETVQFTRNPFIPESDIPVVYGNDEFQISENEIICGIDIVASVFFMLTRWEEYIIETKDRLGRFCAHNSLAYRNHFLHRPVVDEYVEMLRRMMGHLGYTCKSNKHRFTVKLTHDVDRIKRFPTLLSGIRQTAAELIVDQTFRKSCYTAQTFIGSKVCGKNDPYDTFDEFMDMAEQIETRAEFYFIPSHKGEYDARYDIGDKTVGNAVSKIQSRGHIIGIHPSLNSFENPQQLAKEKARLDAIVNSRITGGRHHYLRISIPQTWQMWEDTGLQYDSSLGYHDVNGFRAGTCHDYPLFNFLTRQALRLREYPLIVMEQTFSKLSPERMEKETLQLLHQTQKYNGCFVWLWHTCNWDTYQWAPYRYIYRNTVLNIFK